MKNLLIILPILFPFLAAITIAVAKFQEKKRNVFAAVSVILNLVFVVYLSHHMPGGKLHLLKINEFLDIYFKIDKLSIFFSSLVLSGIVFHNLLEGKGGIFYLIPV